MTPRRVVITGLGIVSAAGCQADEAWRHLLQGRSAVRRIRRFDAGRFPSQIAAEIDEDALPRDVRPGVDRIARYGMIAASMAIEDARLLDGTANPTRVGIVMAAGMGRYHHDEVFPACATGSVDGKSHFDWGVLSSALLRDAQPDAAARRTPGSIPAAIAAHYEFGGPTMAVMTACAGGTQAIGDGMRWIRCGRADVVVAGGTDSELYPMGVASFCLLGALSTKNSNPMSASRPFDAGRDGFVIGEGAGALVLEELEHARRRGAQIYAEASGFGSACDAHRATDPHPQGAGAVLAMQRALADGQLNPHDIGYINAHGTSTPANDRAETVAIKHVFGERARHIPISATKSMIGHATVAAGAIEAIVCALTLRDQIIHPTINYESIDPDCDLDYVPNVARPAQVDAVLSNSFAFGGQAACLLLRRADG